MSSNKFVSAAAVALLTLSVAASFNASAATATSTMGVAATVVAVCTVSAGTLTFADYSGAAVAGQADLTVNCSKDAPYTIGLGAGAGTGASTATRILNGSFAGSTMTYGLYQDVGYATPWGDTVDTDTFASDGTGLAQTFPVYGQITAGQNVSVGTYSDSVAVTINY